MIRYQIDPVLGLLASAISLEGTDSDPDPQRLDIDSVEGVHDLYVVNTTEQCWHFIKVWWFEFDY